MYESVLTFFLPIIHNIFKYINFPLFDLAFKYLIINDNKVPEVRYISN